MFKYQWQEAGFAEAVPGPYSVIVIMSTVIDSAGRGSRFLSPSL